MMAEQLYISLLVRGTRTWSGIFWGRAAPSTLGIDSETHPSWKASGISEPIGDNFLENYLNQLMLFRFNSFENMFLLNSSRN